MNEGASHKHQTRSDKIMSSNAILKTDEAGGTGIFRLVVQKLRRESAHARPFGGDFELKMLRMRGFSSQFLDNHLYRSNF